MQEETSSTSRVLHLVFTDVVESTALKAAQGDQPAGEILRRAREQLIATAAELGGRVVDFAGDGCFLTFETASGAVRFGLALQERHARSRELPPVRVGIHVGEVTEHAKARPERGPQLEGLAIDLASRIQGLARPGQVLASAAVAASARQRLRPEQDGRPIRWQSHGRYELKGASEPVEIVEVGLEGIAPFTAPQPGDKARRARRHPSVRVASIALGLVVAAALAFLLARRTSMTSEVAPIRSLAVLPLDNLSRDPEQEYFADGMTEALIGELAKLEALRVISRTSVMQYKGARRPLREIAAELGVDAIIEGTVLREGEQVRITAQLIDARSDHHVWSHSYDRELRAVLQIQSEVARAVAERTAISLSPRETARLAPPRAVDPRAQDAYYRGLQSWSRFSPEGFERALGFFEAALRIDPDYALAHSAVGWSYMLLSQPLRARPHLEAMPRARAAALRALELDPNLGEAHGVYAAVLFWFDWDWDAAGAEFRRALELSPHSSQSRTIYSFYLWALGQPDEALRQADEAVAFDPRASPLARAELLVATGQVERALVEIDRAREMAPDMRRVFSSERRAREALGQLDAALVAARSELGPERADASDALERAWRDDGARGYWRFWASEYERQNNLMYAALADANAGNDERAIATLQRAFERRDGGVVLTPRHRAFDRFRSDPRFAELVSRLRLPRAD